jgi:hypothetical protein
MMKDIDLRDPLRYAASIEWLRSKVTFGGKTKSDVLQLNVALPKGAVTLFMDTANQYIMAFRGADGICVLNDDRSESFKSDLQLRFRDTKVFLLQGLGAGHGQGGLETFSNRHARGRVFTREDLDFAAELSAYSNALRNMSYERLRPHLSLLVCMISESARIPMMEYDFTNMLYFGCRVWADEAIRSYNDARYILPLAYKIFPDYPRHFAVEKLANRARELDEILGRLRSLLGFNDRSALVAGLLGGKIGSGQPLGELADRFRGICKELKISDPAAVTQLISTARNAGAIRAARQGVAIPRIS